jgi:sarcosine oxidase gamma subunit
VLELARLPSDVVGWFAKPAALDQLADTELLSVRIAPDELLLLDERERLTELETELAALDASGIVVDLSSAYAAWALRGDSRTEAFCRLSQLRLPKPPATVQGLVAHVPAKVIVRPGELLVLVASVLSHHLRERVLAACADLAADETRTSAAEEEALA